MGELLNNFGVVYVLSALVGLLVIFVTGRTVVKSTLIKSTIEEKEQAIVGYKEELDFMDRKLKRKEEEIKDLKTERDELHDHLVDSRKIWRDKEKFYKYELEYLKEQIPIPLKNEE